MLKCSKLNEESPGILTYYGSQTDIPIKSYTRFKLKKNSVKKAFPHYEWRNPPCGPFLVISTGEFPQMLPRVQLANSTDEIPPKTYPFGKSFETVPF